MHDAKFNLDFYFCIDLITLVFEKHLSELYIFLKHCTLFLSLSLNYLKVFIKIRLKNLLFEDELKVLIHASCMLYLFIALLVI